MSGWQPMKACHLGCLSLLTSAGPPGSKLRGLAAGKRKAPSLASTLHGKGKTKPVVRPGATGIDAGRNAITAAVAAHIAAGATAQPRFRLFQSVSF